MLRAAIIHNHPIHYKHLLFQELARQGLDFEVLFTAASSQHRIEPLALDQKLYRYRFGFAGPYEQAPTVGTIMFVWSALNELVPDVVIISGYYDAAAWTAWAWSRARGKPRIVWAESNSFDRKRPFWKERLKRWFLLKCQAAHVYGTSSKQYLCSLGMAPERVFVKRAVADVALFLDGDRTPPEKPAWKVLLYVGRFSAEKNLAFLIRALARVPQNLERPRLVLALVGYGPLEQHLRRLVEKLGLSRAVEFWGKATQAELPAVYRKADLFVLPSRRETWGLVVNEAMLCGLPVLVSERCGCAADLVTPQTGWTFSPFDEAGLAELLDRVSCLPRDQLEAMGTAARRLAAVYSPETCARIAIESLCTVLASDVRVTGQ